MEHEIKKFIKLTKKQPGTDKVLKFVQYLARFMAYVSSQNGNMELAKKSAKFMSSVSLSRKAPRLGMNLLKEFVNVNDLLSKKASVDVLDDNLKLTKCMCLTYYWYNDNIVFLTKNGIIKRDAAYHGTQGNRGWFCSVILGTVLHLKALSEAYKKEDELVSSDPTIKELVEIRRKIQKLRLDLVNDMCNIIVSFNFAKFTEYRVNEGLLGVLGMLSALITLRNIY